VEVEGARPIAKGEGEEGGGRPEISCCWEEGKEGFREMDRGTGGAAALGASPATEEGEGRRPGWERARSRVELKIDEPRD